MNRDRRQTSKNIIEVIRSFLLNDNDLLTKLNDALRAITIVHGKSFSYHDDVVDIFFNNDSMGFIDRQPEDNDIRRLLYNRIDSFAFISRDQQHMTFIHNEHTGVGIMTDKMLIGLTSRSYILRSITQEGIERIFNTSCSSDDIQSFLTSISNIESIDKISNDNYKTSIVTSNDTTFNKISIDNNNQYKTSIVTSPMKNYKSLFVSWIINYHDNYTKRDDMYNLLKSQLDSIVNTGEELYHTRDNNDILNYAEWMTRDDNILRLFLSIDRISRIDRLDANNHYTYGVCLFIINFISKINNHCNEEELYNLYQSGCNGVTSIEFLYGDIKSAFIGAEVIIINYHDSTLTCCINDNERRMIVKRL